METKLEGKLDQAMIDFLSQGDAKNFFVDSEEKLIDIEPELIKHLPFAEQKKIRDDYVQSNLPFFEHEKNDTVMSELPLIESASNNVVVVSAMVPKNGVYANQLVMRDAVTGDILDLDAPYRRAHTIGVTLAASPANPSRSKDHRVAVAVRGMVPVVHPYAWTASNGFCEGQLLYAGENWQGIDTGPLVAVVRSHALHVPFTESLQPLCDPAAGGYDIAIWTASVSNDLDSQIRDGSIVHNVKGSVKRHFKCMSGGNGIYAPELQVYDPDSVATPAWQIVTLAKLYHDDNYVDVILP